MYASRRTLTARISLAVASLAVASLVSASLVSGCDVLFPGGDETSPVPSADTSVVLDGSPGGGSCALLSIDPADGQTIASNEVTITVRFSAPLASEEPGGTSPVTLVRLDAQGGVAETLAPNVTWGTEGTQGVLHATPVGWLRWDTVYRVIVSPATRCADGSALNTEVTSTFRTPPQGGVQPTGGVYYACQDGGGRLSLRRVGLDGAGDAEVADLGAAFPGGSPGTVVRGMPSPDGKRVVWAVLGSDQFTSALIGYRVDTGAAYLVSAGAVVTGEDVLAQVFDISSTGEVAFLGPLAGGQRDQITVVGLDGGGARTVLTASTVMDSLAGVAWTADGARLMVLAAGGANPGLYEVDAATGAETLKKSLNQQAILGLPGHMAYDAASGRAAISFTKNFGAQDENSELLAWADLGLSPVFNSGTATVNEGTPVLTPGGGRLVFTQYSATDQVASVAAYDFASGSVSPLLMSGGAVQTYSFTSDGETVVYTDSDGQGGTLLLARTGSEAPRTLSQTAVAQCNPGLAVVLP